MDGFSYHDIFATKGIEYLIVISFFAVIIPFWRFLHKPARAALDYIEGAVHDFSRWFNLAEDAFFHQGHAWARAGRDGIVTVGMDDFAHKLIGRPDSIRLPKVGETLAQGEAGWTLHVKTKKIAMLSPVTGRVVAVNNAVSSDAAGVGKDPYGKGWLVKVEPASIKRDLKNLLNGRLAASWMEGIVSRLQFEIGGKHGVNLQDGGSIVSGFSRHISGDNWDLLARKYLLTEDVH